MNRLLSYGGKYIYNDNNVKTKYNSICSRSMDRALKRFTTVFLCVMLSFVIALFGPIYAYIVDGKRSSLLSVRLPFFEQNSDSEFILLIIIQTISGICGLSGNIAIETGYNLNINVLRVTTELIELDIGKLSSDLETKTLTISQMKHKLCLIFDKIRSIDKYY